MPTSGKPNLGGRGHAPPPVRILDFFSNIQGQLVGPSLQANGSRERASNTRHGPGLLMAPIRRSGMTVEARIALRFVQATLACRLHLPGTRCWHPFRALSNLQGSSRHQYQRRAGQVYGNARRREGWASVERNVRLNTTRHSFQSPWLSRTMAFKNLLACCTEPCAILLQALLNR